MILQQLRAVPWWGWVGIGIIVLALVGQAAGGGGETTPRAVDEQQEDVVGEYGRERAIDYISEGMTFLALEYGIRIDKDVLKSMLSDDETAFVDIGGGEILAFTLFDWWHSPSDKADAIRDVLLEAGEVPREFMQKVADVVAAHQGTVGPE